MTTVVAVLAVALMALVTWRYVDLRAEERAWDALVSGADGIAGTYDPALVQALPEPAQRYFNFAIAPGTPLYAAVELEMTGELALGTKASHRYRAMSCRQILAPPSGLVWQVETGPMSGSDVALPTQAWSRFWLLRLLPVARASSVDHRRSAFGRVVAEAAFWAPASLLPGEHVRWEPINENSARAVVQFGEQEQAVDVTVNEQGAPISVVIQRWSNENPERTFRKQPFGGNASAFRQFGGYRLPTRVEGGNHFGTQDYFAFFKAQITNVHFPQQSDQP